MKKILLMVAMLFAAVPAYATDVWQQHPQVYDPVSGTFKSVWNTLQDQGDGTYDPEVAAVNGASVNDPITDSCSVANASCLAQLTAVSGKYTYVTGFQCTASGATAAAVVTVTLVGAARTTDNYTFVFPAGVTTAAQNLAVNFATPLRANAVGSNISVTLPAGGSGNTNATCSIQGYRQ